MQGVYQHFFEKFQLTENDRFYFLKLRLSLLFSRKRVFYNIYQFLDIYSAVLRII